MEAFVSSAPLAGHSVLPALRLHSQTLSKAQVVQNRRARAQAQAQAQDATIHMKQSAPSSSTKEDSRLEPPPATFFQAIKQAQAAVSKAIADGERLLEVEFPPLPAEQMESSSTSSYDVSDANFRLALDFVKRFVEDGFGTVVLALPDLVEKDRLVQMCGDSEYPMEGVRIGSVCDRFQQNLFEQIWLKKEPVEVIRPDDGMFVILGATAQELPDVERLVEKVGDRPVIFFNLKLDVSRGDLGLPAFPSKAMHFRFLSKILPAYYLRTRGYSRSIPVPPFLVNYSGALYKVYPQKWQVLLDNNAAGERSGDSSYIRVATFDERPSLGEVRDIMTANVKVDGVDMTKYVKSAAPLMDLLRKGYKVKTWWEDDTKQQLSNKWRQ